MLTRLQLKSAHIGVLSALSAVLLVIGPEAAWASGCSAATIKGNYGFVFSGFGNKGNGPPIFPFNGAGLITFDGMRSFSGSYAYSFNGDSFTASPATGAYTVNPDCTGLINGTNGTNNFAFVIVSGGAEILFANLAAGQTFTVDAKKQ
jgi:hypothetical protein